MEVLLLGTGSADGWPNAFCSCASCTAVRDRGEVRGPTAALVDGRLLLDCGPEAPRAAQRAGADLGSVTHLLLTHDHPDHSSPVALLSRSWAGRREPLQVLGSPAVLREWERWLAPHDPVELRATAPGDVLDCGRYAVRVLPAAHRGGHGEQGLLFDVTAPDGGRLLYATDTGPLPPDAVVPGAAYDVVLLEETFGDRTDHGTDHLDLVSFAGQLERLRSAGAVVEGTDVVAVHLSHHNAPDVAARLHEVGARAGRDLEVVRPGRRERLLVLGGARSGKSTHAERLLAGEVVTYVATGPAPSGDDDEWAARVAAHRARRPAAWRTVETSDVAGVLGDARGAVLVDCLTLWLADRLDAAGAWEAVAGWEARVEEDVAALLAALSSTRARVVVVSNEVGAGVVPATASGRVFRDWQGRLNARVADVVDRVVLVVAGRPLELRRSG